jgi:hypothetical protein
LVSWGGLCAAATGDSCTITVTAAGTVTARFAQRQTLTVTPSGGGAGRVVSSPAGIDCAAAAPCSSSFPVGTVVTLTATATAGSIFTGWSGSGINCQNAPPTCAVTLSANRTVTASFVPTAVVPQRTGVGTAAATIATVNGSTSCTLGTAAPCLIAAPPIGSLVQVSAVPESNFQRTGWSGACEGQGGVICTFTWTGTQPIVGLASGTPTLWLISVRPALNSTGRGRVQVANAMGCEMNGQTLGGQCDGTAPQGWGATYIPQPEPGFIHAGWGGDCAGVPAGTNCVRTTTRDYAVTARFIPESGTALRAPAATTHDGRARPEPRP